MSSNFLLNFNCLFMLFEQRCKTTGVHQQSFTCPANETVRKHSKSPPRKINVINVTFRRRHSSVNNHAKFVFRRIAERVLEDLFALLLSFKVQRASVPASLLGPASVFLPGTYLRSLDIIIFQDYLISRAPPTWKELRRAARILISAQMPRDSSDECNFPHVYAKIRHPVNERSAHVPAF